MCRRSLRQSEYAEEPAPVCVNLSMVPLQNSFAVLSHNKHFPPEDPTIMVDACGQAIRHFRFFYNQGASDAALPHAGNTPPFRPAIRIQPLRLVCFLLVDGTMSSSDIRNDASSAGRRRDIRASCVARSNKVVLLPGASFGC